MLIFFFKRDVFYRDKFIAKFVREIIILKTIIPYQDQFILSKENTVSDVFFPEKTFSFVVCKLLVINKITVNKIRIFLRKTLIIKN